MEKKKKIKMTRSFDLWGAAIKIWWDNFGKFIMLYVWGIAYAAIPLAIALLIIIFGIAMHLWNNALFVVPAFFVCFWALLFMIYYSVRIYLSMFLLLKHNYAKPELEIYKESANYFWSYISLIFITFILVTLWFMALFIPAIIFSIFYTFACYAFIFEGKRDIDAVKRSHELVRGYWWAVLGRFFLFGLALSVFMMIISLPLNFLATNGIAANIWQIIVQVINYLIGPIALIFTYSMYQNLVKIKK